MIAIITVFRNLKLHGRAIESNLSASRINEIVHRCIGSHVIIYHDPTAIDTCADAVIEHQWHAMVNQMLEMIVLNGVLSLRHNDATNLVFIKRLAYFYLATILFIALRYHDSIASGRCFFFNTTKN